MGAKRKYLSLRFDHKGRGITQEFNLLDVNRKRFTGWMSERKRPRPSLSSV